MYHSQRNATLAVTSENSVRLLKSIRHFGHILATCNEVTSGLCAYCSYKVSRLTFHISQFGHLGFQLFMKPVNFLIQFHLICRYGQTSCDFKVWQCHRDQQGMEWECSFYINSVTENNTPHDKVILPLLLHKFSVIFSRCVHLKLGHPIPCPVEILLWSWWYCPFKVNVHSSGYRCLQTFFQ